MWFLISASVAWVAGARHNLSLARAFPLVNPRNGWKNAARRRRVLVVEDEFLVRIDLGSTPAGGGQGAR